jgi:uncharacterized membrane protein YkvA (DUF1232 family)
MEEKEPSMPDQEIELSKTQQTSVAEYALLVPRLVKLIWKLARDPRVPARLKALLFLLAGYLVSPIDLIPDFLPGIGQADDLLITVFVLDQILNRVPPEVITEHWDGDEDLLEVVQQILDIATGFVPNWLKERLGAR